MALILGIETSCDETAAAVVEDGRKILSNVVASQIDIHAPYGGVFPEIASREHVLKIVPVIEDTLKGAGITFRDLAAIAVTHGPGLAGALLVGVNTAKALAYANDLPLLGINHLEGHIYANWLEASTPSPISNLFPLIALIVSGGHSEIVLMRGHNDYQMLGRTLDDAAGEAFDKVARLLGLGYPGGPAIQKAAEDGDASAFKLPRAWLRGTYDYSFSGLKTAALHLVQSFEGKRLPVADIAASFQAAITDVLVEKTVSAASEFGAHQILLAGGVAANTRLRKSMLARADVAVLIPPPQLCIDNGAMIASAAWWHLERGERSGWDLDVVPSLQIAEDRVQST
ncbi:MAG: tRNA (adenosine(37)-N6)-threonylcarbamoyltransferase complex transferase subunit TsaD, partial [Chloroflexota bacterium]|nr:tRNA (adenosine(37)-N6)-threonylcarbamoyltransferase complex transferase subunit TsaD [Chloroflexota bacterium]